MADKGLPFIFATAATKPQRSATAASIERILPEKRACSSTYSHVSQQVNKRTKTDDILIMRTLPLEEVR
jgi:hypothetical protein